MRCRFRVSKRGEEKDDALQRGCRIVHSGYGVNSAVSRCETVVFGQKGKAEISQGFQKRQVCRHLYRCHSSLLDCRMFCGQYRCRRIDERRGERNKTRRVGVRHFVRVRTYGGKSCFQCGDVYAFRVGRRKRCRVFRDAFRRMGFQYGADGFCTQKEDRFACRRQGSRQFFDYGIRGRVVLRRGHACCGEQGGRGRAFRAKEGVRKIRSRCESGRIRCKAVSEVYRQTRQRHRQYG